MGFGAISRRRGFTIFIRRDCAEFLVTPQDVYDRLMLADGQLTMADILIGTPEDIAREQPAETATRQAVNDYLTLFEVQNKSKYEKILDESRPEESHFLQAYIWDQNPDFCCKMSRNGAFNTFTHKDKVTWLRGLNRKLLGKEKFIGHSWPVTPELAAAMGVPALQQQYKHAYTCMEIYAYMYMCILRKA